MNKGIQAALDHKVTELIVVGDSRLAIQQSMGVIECKKYSLQMKLARYKELVDQFDSIRYLHVTRSYNASADTMATEALEAKAGQVVGDPERLNKLQKLNRIQEGLLVEPSSSKDEKEPPTIAATTRSKTRRVRFND